MYDATKRSSQIRTEKCPYLKEKDLSSQFGGARGRSYGVSCKAAETISPISSIFLALKQRMGRGRKSRTRKKKLRSREYSFF